MKFSKKGFLQLGRTINCGSLQFLFRFITFFDQVFLHTFEETMDSPRVHFSVPMFANQ